MKASRILIGAALACLSTNLFAQKKLVSVLIPTGADAELYPGPSPGMGKVRAKQLPKPILSLGGKPTYDMRQALKQFGVALDTNETIIYSAASHLLYVRASKEKITLITPIFEWPDYSPFTCRAELQIRRIDDPNNRQGTQIADCRFPLVSGSTFDYALADHPGAEARKLSFEMTIGSDAKTFDITVSGQLPIMDEGIPLKLRSHGKIGSPITLYERAKTASSGPGLLATLKLLRKNTGTPSEEWLNHKIGEIEKELKDRGE